jgi:hypothetical protein
MLKRVGRETCGANAESSGPSPRGKNRGDGAGPNRLISYARHGAHPALLGSAVGVSVHTLFTTAASYISVSRRLKPGGIAPVEDLTRFRCGSRRESKSARRGLQKRQEVEWRIPLPVARDSGMGDSCHSSFGGPVPKRPVKAPESVRHAGDMLLLHL